MFSLLSIIIFCNLNEIISSRFGITAGFSPLILLLSFLVIFFTLEKIKYSNGFKFILFVYIIYLFLSTCTALSYQFRFTSLSLNVLYRDYLATIITIITFYGGFYYCLIKNPGKLFSLFSLILLFTLIYATIEFSSNIVTRIVNQYEDSNRATGFFANPNNLGSYGNFSLTWFLFLMNRKQTKFKLILVAGILLSLYVTGISLSKSAIIASIVILLIFVFIKILKLKQSGKIAKVFTIVFLIVFFLAIINLRQTLVLIGSNFENDTQRRIESISNILVDRKIDTKTTTERTLIWNLAYQEIIQRPIFGSGFGSMHYLKNAKFGTHNIYLLIVGEAGILCLLIFVLFIVFLLYESVKEKKVEYQFLYFGIIFIFFGQLCMSGHYILKDKISVGFLVLIIAIMATRKSNLNWD